MMLLRRINRTLVRLRTRARLTAYGALSLAHPKAERWNVYLYFFKATGGPACASVLPRGMGPIADLGLESTHPVFFGHDPTPLGLERRINPHAISPTLRNFHLERGKIVFTADADLIQRSVERLRRLRTEYFVG